METLTRDENMKYSNERKEAVLRQLEAPNGPTIQELSKKERISVSTLEKWRSEARNGGKPMPNSKVGQEIWSSQDK